MTEERQDITADFYAGNKKDIRVTVRNSDGSAKDLTGAEVTYVIFTDPGKPVLVKSSARSQITLTNPVGGVFTVHILAFDTLGLSGTYRHQANVVDAAGVEETVMSGKIVIFKSYARRFRLTSKPAYITGG